MAFKKDGTSFRVHSRRVHTCPCGRVVAGNGFYQHTYNCPKWLEWKDKQLARTGKLLTALEKESWR